MLVYVPAIVLSLLGWVPIESSSQGFLLHLLPIVLAMELWLLVLNNPYNDRRTRQRRPLPRPLARAHHVGRPGPRSS